MHPRLVPSILTADFSQLGNQIKETLSTGIQTIHIDVMDGHFVPNLTIGSVVAKSIKSVIKTHKGIMDVHLMVENPDSLIPGFAKAGADIISVHIEAVTHLHRTLMLIKDLGIKAGVVLNPSTPLTAISEIIPYVDLILIMSVNPGFGGQSYIKQSTLKIKKVHEILRSHQLEDKVLLEVDGGINSKNIREVVSAGANFLVVGSAIYNAQNSIANNIRTLQALIDTI